MTAPLTRTEMGAFGERVTELLLDGDDAVLVDVGALAPSTDCDFASCTATIVGHVGKQAHKFTGNALHLEDAVRLARGKLRDARKRHAAELAKAKAEKVSA